MNTSSPQTRVLALLFAPLIAGAFAAQSCGSKSGSGGNHGTGGNNGGNGSGGNRGSGGTNGGNGSGGNRGTGGNNNGSGTGGNNGGNGTGGNNSSSGSGGGTPFMASCTPSDPLISDMEDGNYYYGNGCPKGGWYLSSAGAGTYTVDSPMAWVSPAGNVTPTDCTGGMSSKCIHISGVDQMNSGATTYDANGTLSASLNRPDATNEGVVDASAYTGVQFWGKVTGMNEIRIQVADQATEPAGGQCAMGTNGQCYDHPGKFLDEHSDWFQYQIPFADLTQEGFGNVSGISANFPKNAVYSINFKIMVPAYPVKAPTWELWVDDLKFY